MDCVVSMDDGAEFRATVAQRFPWVAVLLSAFLLADIGVAVASLAIL